ncbi:MAG: type II toxin-antitoxin system VapC family toxin [Candidatus Woesearchaeota archaeon]
MTYVLDTSAIIKALKHPELADKLVKITDAPLIMTSVCKQELLSVRSDKEQYIIKQMLDTMQILDHTSKAAECGAEIYKELCKKGTLVNEFEILIAGICKANNAHLITFDKDFSKIKGLQVTVL